MTVRQGTTPCLASLAAHHVFKEGGHNSLGTSLSMPQAGPSFMCQKTFA